MSAVRAALAACRSLRRHSGRGIRHYAWLLLIAIPCAVVITLASPAPPDNVRADAPTPLVFAVIGDFGNAGLHEQEVATLVASWSPAFVTTVGDNNYPAGDASTIDQNIGQYYHAYPVVLIVPDASAVQSAADLAGLRVGIPGRFGESWFGLKAALHEAGLTESDVEVVEIGYTAQAALTTSQVDAVVGFANNDLVQFGLAGIPTRAVPLAAGDVPLVSIVLATTKANLDANPETARKVARSMVAGIEKVVAEPASAIEAGRDHIPTLDEAGAAASAKATLEATLPLWRASGRPTGEMDEQAWADMVAFMRSAGLITADVAAGDAMTNDAVE